VAPVRAQTLAQLEQYIQDREKDSLFFGIFVGSEHVGNIKAGPVDWEHHRARVGILIGEKEYWGKGYGTKALKQLCDHAFARGIHCLFAGIVEGNHGSLSAFLKAGFVRSGEIPDYWRFEGEWRAQWLVTRINPSASI
jgi:RimJ/RimL family protein N-acetyltransferase